MSWLSMKQSWTQTLSAMSTFSLGMFVHVRCMHVSMPMRLWHVLTSSEVSSDVRPPAFLRNLIMSMNQAWTGQERTR
jgi:hypothetical protein